jgi:hypothetical protein
MQHAAAPPGPRPSVYFSLKFCPKKADKRIRIRAFMLEHFRNFLPATAGVLGVATVLADAGYLPLAGPSPLRFRVVATAMSEPPAPPVPPATISLPSPPMPAAPKETNGVPPVPAATNGPALEFNARDSAKVSAPTNAPDAVVSPQMLIKYFTTLSSTNATTNSALEKVIDPVGFTPPIIVPPPTPPASNKPANPAPH